MLSKINTFQELQENTEVLTSVLDIMDKKDFFDDGTFRLHFYDHGSSGYALKLEYKTSLLIESSYYCLDNTDESWVSIKNLVSIKESDIFCVYAYGEYKNDSFVYYPRKDDITIKNDIDICFDDYNEAQYEQLKFLYPENAVKCGMLLSKLTKSDPNRDYRQFCYIDNPDITMQEVLQMLRDRECKK